MNRFPRGAKSSKLCTLDMLKTDGSVPQMSLFKHKRVKGWWPFHVKNEGEEMELTVMFVFSVCESCVRPGECLEMERCRVILCQPGNHVIDGLAITLIPITYEVTMAL